MKGKRFLLSLGFMIGLLGCGPDMAMLKSYVQHSPQRTIAIVPLALAPNQKDIRKFCADVLNEKLKEVGFEVRRLPNTTPGGALPPYTLPPSSGDLAEFGHAMNTPLVLVGEIAVASDYHKRTPAKYRNEEVSILDANNRPLSRDVRVEVNPGKPEQLAGFSIHLKLINVESDSILWQQSSDDSIPNWSLPEIARYQLEDMVVNLAQTYASKKL